MSNKLMFQPINKLLTRFGYTYIFNGILEMKLTFLSWIFGVDTIGDPSEVCVQTPEYCRRTVTIGKNKTERKKARKHRFNEVR